MDDANAVNDGPRRRFWDEPALHAWWSWWHLPELVAVFAIGISFFTYLYAGAAGVRSDELGVPGHDSFYHVKMALLLPELGLVEQFPWLSTTVFADRFVNHHYGFHMLLSPFVQAAQALTGDALAGGRWFETFFFAASMVAFQILLMMERVRHRWLWLVLYLLMPAQFFGRHVFVRAINPSLFVALLLCIAMFRRRYLLAAVVVAAYVHLYLGGVIYGPLIVGTFFLTGLVGPPGARVSWKLPAWGAVGWLVGIVTHPYVGGLFEFLNLQVFGSGLSPDIPVGREWKSYSPAWFFAEMSGVTLVTLAVCICARLRRGGLVNARTLTLLAVNFIFLGLTLKARRFIEYWPVFATLAAAYLTAPLRRAEDRDAEPGERNGGVRFTPLVAAILTAICYGCIAGRLMLTGEQLGIDNFVAEWRTWLALAGMCLAHPLARIWATDEALFPSERPWLAPFVAGPVAFGVLAVLVWLPLRLTFATSALASRVLPGATVIWMLPMALYVTTAGCAMVLTGEAGAEPSARVRERVARTASAVLVGGTVMLLLILISKGSFVDLRQSIRCGYDLPAIRQAMEYLRHHSPKDSLVFTDDWDVFPVYFYYNHHNRYIVGLDPKFSHERDPELWERYVRISRGQVPANRSVTLSDDQGRTVEKTIQVELTDIRDRFGCRFVIIDRDHLALARRLDDAPDLATRVFPVEAQERPPYLIYEIQGNAESTAPTEDAAGDQGRSANRRDAQ